MELPAGDFAEGHAVSISNTTGACCEQFQFRLIEQTLGFFEDFPEGYILIPQISAAFLCLKKEQNSQQNAEQVRALCFCIAEKYLLRAGTSKRNSCGGAVSVCSADVRNERNDNRNGLTKESFEHEMTQMVRTTQTLLLF